MYASLAQLVRGWSRILYDALDRRTGRLLVRLLDVLIFLPARTCRPGGELWILLASGVGAALRRCRCSA